MINSPRLVRGIQTFAFLVAYLMATPYPLVFAEADSTYVVQKGDSLQKIAAKRYQDFSKWREIQKANPQITDPNRLNIGWKLVIPAIELPISVKEEKVPTTTTPPVATPTQVTFLYFNDFHGALEPVEEKVGDQKVEKYGIARMATEVKRIRAENQAVHIPTFFVTTGDLLQGTVLSNLNEGQLEVDYLNQLGLDFYTIGNHELDFGPNVLSSLLVGLTAQCVTANYYLGKTKRSVGKPDNVSLGNLKIGIAGLVAWEDFKGEDTKVAAKYLKGVDIEAETPKAKQLVEDFHSQGVTLIVLLSHLGFDRDQELAKAVPGIDVIIGGDSHTPIKGPHDDYLKAGDTYIVQAGDRGHYLGRLDLHLDPQGHLTSANAKLIELDQHIKPDPEIAADLQAKKQEMEEGEFSKRVTDATCELDGKREHVRTRETNLGNLVTDVLKETYQTDIAVFNGGAIRDSIAQGPVTFGNIFKTLPFANTAYVLEISGQELLAMLQHSAKIGELGEKGGFLQVAGLRFVWEKGVENGVRNVTVGEKPLDLADTYTVATSSFVADGGDGYTMLAKLPKQKRHEHNDSINQTVLKYLGDHYGKEKPIASPYCENGEPAKAGRIIEE